jgi:hypothetical protein
MVHRNEVEIVSQEWQKLKPELPLKESGKDVHADKVNCLKRKLK